MAAEAPGEEDGPPCPVILYSNRTCPYAQRVHIVLEELKVRAEVRFVDVFGDKGAEFLERYGRIMPDPRQRAVIPLLVHRGAGATDAEPSGGVEAATAESSEADSEASSDLTLVESAIICEYLVDVFEEPAQAGAESLLPRSPQARAFIRFWVDLVDRTLDRDFASVLAARTRDALHSACDNLKASLAVLDAWLVSHTGPGLLSAATSP